jgi:hypothetical protein
MMAAVSGPPFPEQNIFMAHIQGTWQPVVKPASESEFSLDEPLTGHWYM